jgi:signal transduction histidine kinase
MEMLGFVTHELRSPVAAIQSLADTVHKGLAGDLPERAAEIVSRISRNAVGMQDMIRDYLDLSRLERGELEPCKAGVDFVREVAEAAVAQTRALFDERGINLRVEVPSSLSVEVDPDLLRIVLINYLSNAAKYGRENGSARLRVQRERDRMIASVWNDGPGIDDEETGKLFRKFSRLRNETTRGKRGSGLGLFVCKKILELHKGRVWVEGEPGQWVEFYLELPLGQNE